MTFPAAASETKPPFALEYHSVLPSLGRHAHNAEPNPEVSSPEMTFLPAASESPDSPNEFHSCEPSMERSACSTAGPVPFSSFAPRTYTTPCDTTEFEVASAGKLHISVPSLA